MARPGSGFSGIRDIPRWVQYVALAVLAVVTIVLSLMALAKVREPVEGVGETPGYTPSDEFQSGQTEDLSGSPDEGNEVDDSDAAAGPEAPVVEVAALSRVLTALGGDTVIRSLTGPCPTAEGIVETSYDAGATWASENIGAAVPIVSLTRLLDLGGGTIAALGYAADDCAVNVAAASALGGGVWSGFDASQMWRVDPESASTLMGPGGVAPSPGCDIARFSVGAEDQLAVLCSDGSLATSADNGANWVRSAETAGIPDDVSIGPDSIYVSSVSVPGCDGVNVAAFAFNTLEAGATACVSGAAGASGGAVGSVAPGQTALSNAPEGALWLWAGDALVRSNDGGGTWG